MADHEHPGLRILLITLPDCPHELEEEVARIGVVFGSNDHSLVDAGVDLGPAGRVHGAKQAVFAPVDPKNAALAGPSLVGDRAQGSIGEASGKEEFLCRPHDTVRKVHACFHHHAASSPPPA